LEDVRSKSSPEEIVEIKEKDWEWFDNNGGIESFIRRIKGNSILRTLCLSCLDLEDLVVPFIAEYLNRNSSLVVLDVAKNFVTDQGAIWFAEALRVQRLMYLFLISDIWM
jgi:hypothetical protein